jgi:hypothetical protein
MLNGKYLFLLTSMITGLLTPSSSHAATREQIAEVVDLIHDRSIVVLRRQTYEDGSGWITFVQNGLRYTIYNSGERIVPDDPNSAWMSVWLWPDGSVDSEVVDELNDRGLDGVVDFGRDGLREREFTRGGSRGSKGLEHRSFWQEKLDKAVADALAYKQRMAIEVGQERPQ